VTQRMRVLGETAALARTLFPVLQALPWPAVLLDEAGIVACVNEAMEGIAPPDAAGRPLEGVFPQYSGALRGERPWRSQEALVARDSDGQTVHERLWLRAIPAGAVLIVVDETRLQKLESERVQTVRLASLGFMLAGVSHEISNPLAVIYSMVQLLKGQALQDPQMLRKGLESISENVHRVLEISRKLNGFSRAHGGQKRPSAVDRAIEEAIGLVRHEPSFGTVKIEHHRDAKAVIRCNANEMQQVFFNILANAVQAMEGTGRILITTRLVRDKQVEVMIQDDGPGIRPEHLGKIFEPFFSTKSAGRGTGLGLAICNELIREHGGSMRAESTLGKGARFYIELPLWRRA